MARTKQTARKQNKQITKKRPKRRSTSTSRSQKSVQDRKRNVKDFNIKLNARSKPSIPKACFKRILIDLTPHNTRFAKDAVKMLQQATEAYIIKMLQQANKIAVKQGRTTLMLKDIELIQELMCDSSSIMETVIDTQFSLIDNLLNDT
eukprot:329398_1